MAFALRTHSKRDCLAQGTALSKLKSLVHYLQPLSSPELGGTLQNCLGTLHGSLQTSGKRSPEAFLCCCRVQLC